MHNVHIFLITFVKRLSENELRLTHCEMEWAALSTKISFKLISGFLWCLDVDYIMQAIQI